MKKYKYNYVYKITNLINQKCYIGVRSSNCKPEEDTKYWSSSKYVKEAITNYGKENFKKEILSIWKTRVEALNEEIRLHNKHDVGINTKFYNKSKQTATGWDTTGNKDVANKISKKLKGRKIPQKQIEKMLETRKGFRHSEKSKKLMSQKHKGKKVSDKTRRKLSESHKGFKMKEETKEKLRAINKGKKMSAEAIEKTRQAHLGSKRTKESCKRMSQAAIKSFNRLTHNTSKHIKIFDSEGNEKFDCYGNFLKTINDNNLPEQLVWSYRNGGKKIFVNIKYWNLQRIINAGYESFIGWYALII